MYIHPSISCLVVCEPDRGLQPFIAYLQSMPHLQVQTAADLPADLASFDTVVLAAASRFADREAALAAYVAGGGGLLGLVDLRDGPFPEVFGARIGQPGPACEIRVLFQDRDDPLGRRLPDAVYLSGVFQSLMPIADATRTVLYADWHYEHQAVCVIRSAGAGLAASTTLHDYRAPALQQILYRLVRLLGTGASTEGELGIGILGYAPSVGKLHGLGVEHTPGLRLAAICDLSPQRLQQAARDFESITTIRSAEGLADDPDVDLVIVATAPNTHAGLCLQMMERGKHVVCEKPLALSVAETGAMAAMAERTGVHLGCHQNRRWDVDYLAIADALRGGALGDVYYLETFVGGFSHPCGYWHSHAPVSGGTAYDWGGHYLDWIVSLVPDRVRSVRCLRHKRVWHDVSNADQESIHILFAGGQEAVFMHSDTAAIRKPKWYLLGTAGAIVGTWQDVTTYDIDPVLYFFRDDIPPTEMPPELLLRRRDSAGRMQESRLAMPPRVDFCFHRNLADHLLTGEPLGAPLADSMTVVAILEAASRSAAAGGSLEVVHG